MEKEEGSNVFSKVRIDKIPWDEYLSSGSLARFVLAVNYCSHLSLLATK